MKFISLLFTWVALVTAAATIGVFVWDTFYFLAFSKVSAFRWVTVVFIAALGVLLTSLGSEVLGGRPSLLPEIRVGSRRCQLLTRVFAYTVVSGLLTIFAASGLSLIPKILPALGAFSLDAMMEPQGAVSAQASQFFDNRDALFASMSLYMIFALLGLMTARNVRCDGSRGMAA